MSFFNRWCRRRLGLPEEDITQLDLNTAYQLGFQNGRACGEMHGRSGALLELELALAARGKVLNDVEPEEVARAKSRSVH